jgi:hypothetical protein
MSEVYFNFGDGRAILIDPSSARTTKEQIEIEQGNRRWLLQLVKIYEGRDAAPASCRVALAHPPPIG